MQTFTAPLNTTYKIQCWGAQGGSGNRDNNCIGAKGGYTSGKLNLSKQAFIYIYVGQHPIYSYRDSLGQVFPKGYNGGGAGSSQIYNNALKRYGQYGGSGGGATDIRLISSNWNDFNSLKSRIMVAAGGAGGTYRWMKQSIVEAGAGVGGGLVGFNGEDCDGKNAGHYKGTGGTQTYAGNCQNSQDSINGITVKESKLYQGGFGFGGNSSIEDQCGGTGGGGGYYGGGASDRGHANGGGGSSFISGYTGCDAISESSIEDNIIHTGQPNHYSGYIFTNPVMIAGNATMPKPKGGTETGHAGDGYCIISWISPSL